MKSKARSPLSENAKHRLRAQVRRLAKDKSAAYCEQMAAFIFMGPTTERDRVVGRAWNEAARRLKPVAPKKTEKSSSMKRIINLPNGSEYVADGEASRLVVTEKAAEELLREAWCAVQAFRLQPISMSEVDELILRRKKPARR